MLLFASKTWPFLLCVNPIFVSVAAVQAEWYKTEDKPAIQMLHMYCYSGFLVRLYMALLLLLFMSISCCLIPLLTFLFLLHVSLILTNIARFTRSGNDSFLSVANYLDNFHLTRAFYNSEKKNLKKSNHINSRQSWIIGKSNCFLYFFFCGNFEIQRRVFYIKVYN